MLYSAIFHDVGYIVSPSEHPKYSAEICEKYLSENGFDKTFIERVLECIISHDNKDLLKDNKARVEVVLLIEADCLDEEGAMSILRDLLSEGHSGNASYRKAYEKLLERRFLLQPNPNDWYFATETAKKIWQEKVNLYIDFLSSLKIDLGE